jgi:hypothetical protein
MRHNLFIQTIKLSQAAQIRWLATILSSFIKYAHCQQDIQSQKKILG